MTREPSEFPVKPATVYPADHNPGVPDALMDRWAAGEGRCCHCVGLSWSDFDAVCDCWQFEREREPLRYRLLRWLRL